jgi:hypothetical protein
MQITKLVFWYEFVLMKFTNSQIHKYLRECDCDTLRLSAIDE